MDTNNWTFVFRFFMLEWPIRNIQTEKRGFKLQASNVQAVSTQFNTKNTLIHPLLYKWFGNIR